jgi:hypothetical protein
VCSCGFRAPLTHATQGGALRAAQVHAAVSATQPAGRYTVELDAGSVVIRCTRHPAEPLAAFPDSLDGHETEALDAIRDHDRQRHEEDRRA